MCQVSMYVKENGEEKLLKENITTMKLGDNSVTVATLFEGETELKELILRHIDFSSGKVLMEKM